MKMTMCAAWFALVYAVAVNAYFGWNWLPSSTAELLADGVVVLLATMVALVAAVERKP